MHGEAALLTGDGRRPSLLSPADRRESGSMDRASILATLTANRQLLAQRFGVREIGLFGSAARDQLRPDSDIDLLVEFDAPPNFDRYFGL